MRPALLLPLLVAWALPAVAAAAGASFGARDPGATACSLFVDMATRAPAGTERQFYDWAQGYFAGRATGAGAGRRLPADGPARARNFEALVEFCRKNPDAGFEAAVVALWSATP